MSEVHELTIKQILDSAWVRRTARLCMILLPFIVGGGGSVIGWIMYQNWQTAQLAVSASSAAAAIAATAVETAEDVKKLQASRADLADQNRMNDLAWRNRFDTSLDDLGEQVGELKGDIGELKGLIVRRSEASTDGVAPPLPMSLFR